MGRASEMEVIIKELMNEFDLENIVKIIAIDDNTIYSSKDKILQSLYSMVANGNYFWSAEADGKVVGYSILHEPPDAEFESRWVFVQSNVRQHGIGGKLVSAQIEFAELVGGEIFAYTNGSKINNDLYRSQGFKIISHNHPGSFARIKTLPVDY